MGEDRAKALADAADIGGEFTAAQWNAVHAAATERFRELEAAHERMHGWLLAAQATIARVEALTGPEFGPDWEGSDTYDMRDSWSGADMERDGTGWGDWARCDDVAEVIRAALTPPEET